MDKVTAVRKRLNREQWKSLISECRSSGMTVSRWCKENNICEQTYYVRRHIVGGTYRTLISVQNPLRLCRTGICRSLSAG